MTCKRHGGDDSSIMCKYCDAETIERYAMNKTEIQSRIEKCESDLASLKADLAKCDSADRIEQERCWFGVSTIGDCMTTIRRTKEECGSSCRFYRPAYMPECRQVEPGDAQVAEFLAFLYEGDTNEFAYELHKRGFRIKVNP